MLARVDEAPLDLGRNRLEFGQVCSDSAKIYTNMARSRPELPETCHFRRLGVFVLVRGWGDKHRRRSAAHGSSPSPSKSTAVPCTQLPHQNSFDRAEVAGRRKKHECEHTGVGARNGIIDERCATSSSCSSGVSELRSSGW